MSSEVFDAHSSALDSAFSLDDPAQLIYETYAKRFKDLMRKSTYLLEIEQCEAVANESCESKDLLGNGRCGNEDVAPCKSGFDMNDGSCEFQEGCAGEDRA